MLLLAAWRRKRQAGDTNAIPPGLLRGVEPTVGSPYHVISSFAVRGKDGDPCADRNSPRHSWKLKALHHPPQFLGDGDGLLRCDLGQQDGEFFSAVAAYHINLAQLLVKERRNLAQHFVPQEMTKLIIQPLELIDIRHDYGHAGSIAAGALEVCHYSPVERTAGVKGRP